VGELVGVDNRSDAGDLAAGDLDADDGDDSLPGLAGGLSRPALVVVRERSPSG
jgi:hypothetical protein